MKKMNKKSNGSKFLQNLRQTLVDYAEESLKSGEQHFISKDGLNRIKGSL